MSDEVQRALGRIEGELKGLRQDRITDSKKLDVIDKRVTSNEVKAARNGAVTGGLMSGFIMLLKTTLSG